MSNFASKFQRQIAKRLVIKSIFLPKVLEGRFGLSEPEYTLLVSMGAADLVQVHNIALSVSRNNIYYVTTRIIPFYL